MFENITQVPVPSAMTHSDRIAATVLCDKAASKVLRPISYNAT